MDKQKCDRELTCAIIHIKYHKIEDFLLIVDPIIPTFSMHCAVLLLTNLCSDKSKIKLAWLSQPGLQA